MSLSGAEKAAGRAFRARAERALAAAWADAGGNGVPCSAQVRFFRHECEAVKGRTRAIALEDRTLTSPEIWVEWTGGGHRVITRDEAEERVAAGEAVEFETILAGKFAFTWKFGQCGRCGMTVMSGEGVLRDMRTGGGEKQDDLAVFTGTAAFALNAGTKREHDIP